MRAAAAAAAAAALLAGRAAALDAPAVAFLLPANASVDDQALLLTAQGLLNRNASRLWLYEPVFWSDGGKNATYWMPQHYLTPVLGVPFVNVSGSFCDMAAATGLIADGVVTGLALYNGSALDATRWLAVTASALGGLLPVTAAQLAAPGHECLASLPVAQDFSQPAARGWTSNVAAYEWGRVALLPQCNPSNLYSAGQSFSDATESVPIDRNGDPAILIGLDGAVALRAFTFNLSPWKAQYPVHAAEFVKLVAAAPIHAANPAAMATVWGWAQPEPEMVARNSEAGAANQCDGAPNLSFWLHVDTATPALPYHATNITLERDRLYVVWQSNEGDTPKIAAGLQQGAWLDPRRGSVPVSWGVSPLLSEFAPGLLNFFARTATANDTFFSATAGAGYTFPFSLAPANYEAYVARVRSLVKAITPGWPPYSWEVDIWDSNIPANISSYAGLAGDAVGAFSMQPEALAGTNQWLAGGPAGPTPLIITAKDLWYPFFQTSDPCPLPAADPRDIMVQRISAAVANLTHRPAFLVVYGSLLDNCNLTMFDYALHVRDAMAAGNPTTGVPPVSVVGMQDFVRLAREAGATMAAAGAAGAE